MVQFLTNCKIPNQKAFALQQSLEVSGVRNITINLQD